MSAPRNPEETAPQGQQHTMLAMQDADDPSPAATASSMLLDEEQQRVAVSSAADSSHLAPVLESVAPVAKCTRWAEQPPPKSVGRILASPILRLMGQDSGARQSLMTMLSVMDLALAQSGRSWCAWIVEEPASVGGQQVSIRGNAVGNFKQCGWIQRAVQDLAVSGACGSQFDHFVLCMPRLSRLRSLKCQCSEVTVDLPLLRESFSAVTESLQHLDVDFAHGLLSDGPWSATIASVWPTIAVLAGLVSLSFAEPPRLSDLDFAFLPKMSRLEQLKISVHCLGEECTPEQVESLAQCRALTDLHCGQWLPPQSLNNLSVEDRAKRTTLIYSRFALLLQRRKELDAAPLRRLYLFLSEIEPAGWVLLSQCTDLEEINASWSSKLTEADWARLAQFQHLRSVSIHRPPSDMGDALSPLLHHGALRALELAGTLDLRAEHAALIARIPSLEVLSCRELRIASLSPLTSAPSLTELKFFHCAGSNGESINIREMIPPMAGVSKLTIIDEMSEVEAAPFDAAVLLRLPKLARVLRW